MRDQSSPQAMSRSLGHATKDCEPLEGRRTMVTEAMDELRNRIAGLEEGIGTLQQRLARVSRCGPSASSGDDAKSSPKLNCQMAAEIEEIAERVARLERSVMEAINLLEV